MKAPIVGVGASAGGLEAISELLSGFPARPGAALIVVQHLDPTRESLLPEILARRTPMPVIAAAEGVAVEPDHIYVIPPNVTLTVAGGVLCLAPRSAAREIHKPVDALFRSLAEDCAETAVGIVLSGADSDGAAGIQAIKQRGGMTFAQLPETARVPSMPQSAIDTGCVDFILPPEEIARELSRLTAHPYWHADRVRAGALDGATAGVFHEAEDGELLRRLFRRLRALHGVDFTRYKSSTLQRRLARRMALQRIDDLRDYVELLEHDAAETSALYQDFLIRVTSFFRDPDSFRVLAEQVFPHLIAGRAPKEPIRIWVPGCATGEEVYSIAIALLDSLGEPAPAAGIQIFGTDVSEAAIDKCRAGVYMDSIAEDVSPERLRRYFVKQNSHYVISRTIRDLCVFARHDITRDPPYSRLDLVSCRNLLIYLGASSQSRVMQVFRYALRPNGYLLLGPSESVGPGDELFEPLDKQGRLYRPKSLASRGGFNLPIERAGAISLGIPAAEGTGRDLAEADSAQRQADRLLLARYAPAGILVDESLNILQFRGQTAPYLAPASGTPSLNLTRIARPELLLAVPPAIHEARDQGRAVRRAGLVIEGLGEIDLEVIPIPQAGGVPCFLILLEDEFSRRPAHREKRRTPTEALSESDKDRRITQVERENLELREFLQATLEQHEAAKDELQSAHEEVLSANEEFQSTNEELETSKEELQSANEELTTTNEELRERNRLLGVLNAEVDVARGASERARAYADGIIETVRESLVVLNGELKVIRVNRAFCAQFETTPERIEGRSLDDVERAFVQDSLKRHLAGVLVQGTTLTDHELVFNHPRLGSRVLCLSARRIAGDAERSSLILVAIEDVTDARRSTDTLREGSRRKDEFLAMLAHELRNPLAAITHATHLLKRGAGENAPRVLDMIERQSANLVRLVNDLLDVARISRGLIELQRELLDLTPIVRSGAEAARGKVEQHRHVLNVAVPDFPLCVEGDRVRLEQVVSNLLENAIKYTPTGGRVNVTLAEEGGEAVLRVSDSGIGLTPANIERIFDVFTQVDSSLARAGGGLGLGLTVVRRVVELHGGRIEARSEGPDRGSEFIVRLPLKSVAPVRSDSPTRPTPADASQARQVLIVDDNRDSADAMAMMIRSWGHEVRTTENGSGALQALHTFAADVALIDIGLPDIDGYELARRLRAETRRRPLRLIAVTGYGTNADRERATQAGFDAHLVKPADPGRLAELLA